MSKPAIFFDRDDTLIRDVPYNGDPGKVELLPGVREALSLLAGAGFKLIIISNQSGVGRGLITADSGRAGKPGNGAAAGRSFFQRHLLLLCRAGGR